MSRLDDLPPDQRATLSLLLSNRKSYGEVATLLSIPERAVHDRAHAALAVLAAKQARELTAEQRERVGDYMLGQHSGVAERLAARTFLDGSPQARAWAHALAGELAPLAGENLPEIPAGAPVAAAAPPSRAETRGAGTSPTPGPDRAPTGAGAVPASSGERQSGSRRGGALLLAAIAVVAIVAVVLIASGGGSSSSNDTAAGEGTASTETATGSKGTSAGTSTSTSTGAGTTTQASRAKEDKRITLRPLDPSSKSIGVAEVLSEGSKYAFYLAAEHLPQSKSKGFFYAVWLYNSPGSFEALSRSPDVGANGRLQGGALLPNDAARFKTMLLTRETSPHPTRPGPIVLSGSFALH